MKVILSIDSIKFPLTGIGRYTFELAKQLQKQIDLELLLYANGKFLNDLPKHDPISLNKSSWLGKQLRKNAIAIKAYRILSSVRNNRALKDYQDSVFHGPGFYLPNFAGPSVATFHDLSIFTHAQYHPPERIRFMRKELGLTLTRASMLITDSDYIRQELASYFGYPLDKIRTVPLACSDDFHPRNNLDTNSVMSRLGLSHGGYTLYAGTIEPRKNIETLLSAYSLLPISIRQRWPLVLAGHHGWKSEHLHQLIKTAENEGWVRYLGYVKDEDFPYLFAGAHLFFFPSYYEGFGLPVLEAMASGVPVICSNTSSLPEVVGDAALMFNPNDVDVLTQLILKGLDDEMWRTSAMEKGLHQASTFSWQKCAQETFAVYQQLLKQ